MRAEDLLALENEERRKRLQWSVVIRYLVITIVTLLSWVGSQFGANFFLPGILFAVAMALGVNLAFSYLYSLKNIHLGWAYAGVLVDMLIITTIVHFTGGITSVFLPLYLLQIVGTNVHFSKLAGPLNFFIGTLSFAGLYLLERQGFLQHYAPFDVAPDLHTNVAYVAATGITLVTLMAVSTYRSGYVVRSLQKLEMELARANEDLVKANRAYQLSNQRLKDLDRMKTEFISVASHQLRTPLSGIKWALKMLMDHDAGPITDNQAELLKKSYQSNERMIALINDLLDVSRIEEGRFTYVFREQELTPLVVELVDEMRHLAQPKQVTIVYEDATKRLPLVNVDSQKFRLALQNLIDNAVKYTPATGTVIVRTYEDRGSVITSIQDTGVGIPAEQQNHVFTKFFRGDNVMRMQTEGTGLGLFIARSVVQQHKGRIWFESHEGRGTTFYILLPATRPAVLDPHDHFANFVQSF